MSNLYNFHMKFYLIKLEFYKFIFNFKTISSLNLHKIFLIIFNFKMFFKYTVMFYIFYLKF